MEELISLQAQKNKLLLNRIAPELITDGKSLQYGNQSISIANLDLFFLLQSNSLFYQGVNMQELQVKDIFAIIKLHALGSDIQNENIPKLEEENNKKHLEMMQLKNPLMENVTIFYRQNGAFKEEFFNVVDSSNIDYVFFNDKRLDFLRIYKDLETNYGGSFTLSLLIRELNRKLVQVPLVSATELINHVSNGGVFLTQVAMEEKKYRDDLSKKVFANEKYGITIIADLLDSKNHQAISYNTKGNGEIIGSSYNGVSDDESTLKEDKKEEETLVTLIPYVEFKKLVRKETEYTEKEKNSVQLYFGFFDDLIYYEDYLVPDLVFLLHDYQQFCEMLALSKSEEKERNSHEKEACDRLQLAIKNKSIHRSLSREDAKENAKRLIERLPDDYLGNTGASGTLFVVLFVILIVVILASITFVFIA